jgi:hypothetical protein
MTGSMGLLQLESICVSVTCNIDVDLQPCRRNETRSRATLSLSQPRDEAEYKYIYFVHYIGLVPPYGRIGQGYFSLKIVALWR